MTQRLAALAALLGATGVMAGAFGAHGLEARVSAESLATWKTAATYQLFHAATLLTLMLSSRALQLVSAAALMAVGTLVFSGSLYLLVLTGTPWLGAITPLGGILLIVGWLYSAVQLVRTGRS